MKKLMAFLMVTALLTGQALALETLSDDDISVAAPYAVLMEKTTGTVIYEKGAHVHCSPASVTKVMTMLLVTEAIEEGRIDPNAMVSQTFCQGVFGEGFDKIK